MNTLSGKNIVITGASSGIGRQIAIEASREGAGVVLIARNVERLNETLSMLVPGNHLVLPFDVTAFDKVEELIDGVVEKLGPVSGFVHAAGVELTLPFRNTRPEHYNDLFGVNVVAGFELARVISKKKNCDVNGASFLFISSVMGRLGKEGKIAYCASKAALTSSVKAMALELAGKKIRCNVLLPGVVKTSLVEHMFATLPTTSVDEIIKQHPMGLGLPEDIANLAVFLLSDKARWITGSELTIDGGYSAG
ncbi:MAG: SDR family oxidoreductase [Bacteroidales bacterium]|nr:SDR family oxidoreductase [Bacteroidales bacterium]